MDYPHKNIWVNGRNVSYQDIVENRIAPGSSKEESVFSFISAWEKGAAKFVLPTSGSTGSPKKFVVSREQMIESARKTRKVIGFTSHDNALLCLDTEYIAGKMMVVRALQSGMKLFVVDPCANPLSKIPVDQTIHFTALVPYQVRSILASKHPHLLDSLKKCLIGGAPLDDETYNRLKNFTSQFYLTYGMTETISHIALHEVSNSAEEKMFTTLPGVKIDTDQRGCLIIHADYLTGEVVTNDVVELFNTEQFVWKGRIDNMINSGGVKIFPEIIEEKIGQLFTRLGLINNYFVYGVPDQRLGERAVLVIESPNADESFFKQLSQELQHTISPYQIPKELYVSSAFTFTPTQKINRQESYKSAHPINLS
jgi:o-succinylbenzoate---CoA ligase